jgi:hypothetical protein
MNHIYHLHYWSVQERANPYSAPEARKYKRSLSGYRDNEESKVITSSIVKINGRKIETSSGSTYILQQIDEEYLTWMNDNGFTYDPDNPIADKTK